MHPPGTMTSDPINRHASLACPHSTSASSASLSFSSLSQPSDLAHVASIVQGLITIAQPAPHPVPSTPNNKPAYPPSAPPSPLCNTPQSSCTSLSMLKIALVFVVQQLMKRAFRVMVMGLTFSILLTTQL